MCVTFAQDPHTPSLEAISFVGAYVHASTRHRLSLVIISKMKFHNDADEYEHWLAYSGARSGMLHIVYSDSGLGPKVDHLSQ